MLVDELEGRLGRVEAELAELQRAAGPPMTELERQHRAARPKDEQQEG